MLNQVDTFKTPTGEYHLLLRYPELTQANVEWIQPNSPVTGAVGLTHSPISVEIGAREFKGKVNRACNYFKHALFMNIYDRPVQKRGVDRRPP